MPIFGNSNIEATGGGFSVLWGCKFTTPADMGDVSSMSVYIKFPSGNMMVGIYTDNAGVPNALVVASASTAISGADGWKTATLATTSLSPNTVYWLAFQSDTSNPNVMRGTGSTNQFAYASNTYGSFPATFPTPTYNAWLMSIYATYTSAAAALPARVRRLLGLGGRSQFKGRVHRGGLRF